MSHFLGMIVLGSETSLDCRHGVTGLGLGNHRIRTLEGLDH